MLLTSKQRHVACQLWDDADATFDNEPDHGLRDPLVRDAWIEQLRRWLPAQPSAILDIGCGTGSLSDRPNLWGSTATDERYAGITDLADSHQTSNL